MPIINLLKMDNIILKENWKRKIWLIGVMGIKIKIRMIILVLYKIENFENDKNNKIIFLIKVTFI